MICQEESPCFVLFFSSASCHLFDLYITINKTLTAGFLLHVLAVCLYGGALAVVYIFTLLLIALAAAGTKEFEIKCHSLP